MLVANAAPPVLPVPPDPSDQLAQPDHVVNGERLENADKMALMVKPEKWDHKVHRDRRDHRDKGERRENVDNKDLQVKNFEEKKYSIKLNEVLRSFRKFHEEIYRIAD